METLLIKSISSIIIVFFIAISIYIIRDYFQAKKEYDEITEDDNKT
ncbi:hypothetical protein [Lacinutrix chionoecetis]